MGTGADISEKNADMLTNIFIGNVKDLLHSRQENGKQEWKKLVSRPIKRVP